MNKSQDNLSRASRLRDEAQDWYLRTFNEIPLSVVELVAESDHQELCELIRRPSVEDSVEEWARENGDVSYEDLQAEHQEEAADVSFVEYIASQYEYAIQDWIDSQEHYPIWGTCFEFRSDPPADWVDHAESVGLVVIEGLEPFETILGAATAGHSFYESYWIPLYLKCFPDKVKEYDGVDFSMM